MTARGFRAAALATIAGVALATGVSTAPSAASDLPRAGDCLMVDPGLLGASGAWVEPDVVDCRAPHTFEVTRVEAVPAGEDPFVLGEAVCGALGVWNELGVNRPVAGIVREPLSIEPRYVGIRTPEPLLVCGAVAWAHEGGQVQARTLTQPFASLGARQRAVLRYCFAAEGARRTVAGAPTVACSSRPRWQAESWVRWSAFYDDYPGRAELKARAGRLCAAGQRLLIPGEAAWNLGNPTTWCLTFYP